MFVCCINNAVIAIFLAVELSKAKLPSWVDWILVAYVIFHVLTHLILTVSALYSQLDAFNMASPYVSYTLHHRRIHIYTVYTYYYSPLTQYAQLST